MGPEDAAAKPLATAHSIGEIVLHIDTWLDVVTRRVTGESVPKVSKEDDWPTLRSWRSALDQLAERQARLLDVVGGMNDSQLDEPSTDGRSRYELIHGSAQHVLYHAGQIVLLGKAIREAKRS
jgi:uncharacterized damage-inducible protein DinB